MDTLNRPAHSRRLAALGMRRLEILAALALLGLAAALTSSAGPGSAPAPTTAAAPAARPVVLELFTSQGCSSCPPADRLLARLGEQSGGAIIPLAFHVDSWNYLGWRDPFSRREWSLRHEAYTRALGELPYTPQAVVAGRASVRGADEKAIRLAVLEAAAKPAADLALALAPTATEIGVTTVVELPSPLAERKLDLLLALFETGLETPVERGENGGRTLRNDYVVRRLERAARLKAGAPSRSEHRATLKLDPDWEPARLGVAALLQDPASFEIHGAAVLAVADAGAGPDIPASNARQGSR